MSSGASEWASEQMSAAERPSEVSGAERANEGAVQAKERVDEQMGQCSRPNSVLYSLY